MGVSFGLVDATCRDERGSLPSLENDVLPAAMPTDGEPAMVGSWLRFLNDASDCLCIELIV